MNKPTQPAHQVKANDVNSPIDTKWAEIGPGWPN